MRIKLGYYTLNIVSDGNLKQTIQLEDLSRLEKIMYDTAISLSYYQLVKTITQDIAYRGKAGITEESLADLVGVIERPKFIGTDNKRECTFTLRWATYNREIKFTATVIKNDPKEVELNHSICDIICCSKGRGRNTVYAILMPDGNIELAIGEKELYRFSQKNNMGEFGMHITKGGNLVFNKEYIIPTIRYNRYAEEIYGIYEAGKHKALEYAYELLNKQ